MAALLFPIKAKAASPGISLEVSCEDTQTPVAKVTLESDKEAILDRFEWYTTKYGLSWDREKLAFIVRAESGFNPLAVNKTSGACGLGQALPCSKLTNICVTLENVDCQVEWMTKYIKDRYGSIANAYAFWLSHSWY